MTQTIGIFNNTGRILVLKGQTKARGKNLQGRRFKDILQPMCINLIPLAFWTAYKKNKVTQSLIDDEIILVNPPPKSEKPEKSLSQTKQELEQANALALLEDEDEDEDGDDED